MSQKTSTRYSPRVRGWFLQSAWLEIQTLNARDVAKLCVPATISFSPSLPSPQALSLSLSLSRSPTVPITEPSLEDDHNAINDKAQHSHSFTHHTNIPSHTSSSKGQHTPVRCFLGGSKYVRPRAVSLSLSLSLSLSPHTHTHTHTHTPQTCPIQRPKTHRGVCVSVRKRERERE